MRSLILLCIIFIGCSKKEGLELEILNKSVISLVPNEKNRFNKDFIQKSKTIVTYKLTNYDEVPYYFNLCYCGGNTFYETDQLQLYRSEAMFYDENDKKVKVNYGIRCSLGREICNDFFEKNELIAKKLNYTIPGYCKYINDVSNFIIYPNQTLYFEWYLCLPYSDLDFNSTYSMPFNASKKYKMQIAISSDSTNYKKYISRTDLQTLRHNNIKVYHGIVKSKNKIPVRFID